MNTDNKKYKKKLSRSYLFSKIKKIIIEKKIKRIFNKLTEKTYI